MLHPSDRFLAFESALGSTQRCVETRLSLIHIQWLGAASRDAIDFSKEAIARAKVLLSANAID